MNHRSEAQAEQAPLLKIRDLHLQGHTDTGWQSIVKGVDLDVHRGKVMGLIGESGAGKSTIGLAAMGYTRNGCRIASGSIDFDGTELTSATPTLKRRIRGRRIAYVAQSAAAAFNPAHSLIDQFVESAVVHNTSNANEARQRAKKLYAELQLPDPDHFGNRYPHQVSGGQLQRAMVAMAMACQPELLIFDEPTTALDVTTQIEVLAAIKRIVNRYSTAGIYITHDLAVVAQIADRITVLRYGQIVEQGATETLLSQPTQEYTRQLLSVRSSHKTEHHNSDTILEMSDIAAQYGGGPYVLDKISLRLAQGTTTAIVGESGSGKSTLARVITGLLPARNGQIRFKGDLLSADLRRRSKDQLRRIQMIYQMPDTALNPKQTVGEIIGRPLRFYFNCNKKEQKKKVTRLLTQIDLGPEFISRYPSELSGGQKQRVCIARALAAEPDVIICDEITSALDQLVAENILELLLRLQTKLGLAFIFISHDIATVRAIADKIIVMLNGQIVEQGMKTEIFTPPHAEYTQLLLSSVPEMAPDWLDKRLQLKQDS